MLKESKNEYRLLSFKNNHYIIYSPHQEVSGMAKNEAMKSFLPLFRCFHDYTVNKKRCIKN
jgi:hypothetical protein